MVGVGVMRGVGVDGCGGGFEDYAWWDVLAVGEGNAFENAAAEGGWMDVLVGTNR